MDPRVAFEVACAARANAIEYLAECRLLQDHGHLGRATALAILGREEAGKAQYCYFLAIGSMPRKRGTWRVLFRRHEEKQQLGSVFEVAQSIVNDSLDKECARRIFGGLLEAADQLPSEVTDEQVREELMPALARIQRLIVRLGLPEGVIQPFKELERRFGAGNLSRIKERGLYVDLDPDEEAVHCPSTTSPEAASEQIRALEVAVDGLRQISEGLDEETAMRMKKHYGPFFSRAAQRDLSTGRVDDRDDGKDWPITEED